jgi:DNA-3-methyladenine glycosylase II
LVPDVPTLTQPTRRKLAAHFRAADPIMAALVEAAGPYRLRPAHCDSPFEHLARAIASQQISGAAARAILGRFVATFGSKTGAFPRPAKILTVHDQRLRAVGFSATKVAALKDLARHTLAGVVPDTRTLESLDDAAIVARLTQVRGIGPWTVQMMLMFQLGRLDVLPRDDYGVRNGFRIAYGKRELPTPATLEKFGARWAPFRSAAAWYLWRAVELGRSFKDFGETPPRVEIRTSDDATSTRRQRPGARSRSRRRRAD